MLRRMITLGGLAWLAAVVGTASATETDRSPLQLVVSTDGLWGYTANRTANSVSRIDLTAGTVVDEFPVGASPTGIAISPDNQTVYTANRGDDSLSVVSVTTKETLQPSR